MRTLDGKNVVLAVCGSIAAVKTVELARELRRRGAEVFPVMTPEAQRILHPDALHYACGHEAVSEIGGDVGHVTFCGVEGDADLLLIAPATVNTISKIACGIGDTAVTTFASAALSHMPVIIAPSMHGSMYDNPIFRRNLDDLEELGVTVIPPFIDEGAAKLASIESIVVAVEHTLLHGALDGVKVVVTGGATSESIDPIRIITSRASGRTGTEIALECYRRGAEVVYIYASRHRHPTLLPEGTSIKQIHVESAADMLDACMEHVRDADVFISSAAVSDYTTSFAEKKIPSGEIRNLELIPTPKILGRVRETYPDVQVVGFKAETNISDDELISRALELKEKHNLLMVIANDVSEGGMGGESNRIIILSDRERVEEGYKDELAVAIVDELVRVLPRR